MRHGCLSHFFFSLTDILKHIFFLQAYDILKEAASLSDAVLHDVQSVSTLSEVCFFCWLQNSNYLKLFSKDYAKAPKILMQLRTSTIRHALLVRDKLEAPWSNGRCGGLVVCVHDFGSNGSGSSLSPGQGHCVMFLDKTQSLFSPRCINGYRRS